MSISQSNGKGAEGSGRYSFTDRSAPPLWKLPPVRSPLPLHTSNQRSGSTGAVGIEYPCLPSDLKVVPFSLRCSVGSWGRRQGLPERSGTETRQIRLSLPRSLPLVMVTRVTIDRAGNGTSSPVGEGTAKIFSYSMYHWTDAHTQARTQTGGPEDEAINKNL